MPGYSSQDLLDALDASPSCLRNVDGLIVHWSRGLQELYGFSAEEAVGQVSHTLLQTRFPRPLYALNEELLETGRWRGDLRHITKTGQEVWVVSYWILQRTVEGRPRLVIEVNNDITDRRRADDASRHLALLVRSSDDAIISKDLNGLVTTWNPGAERLFGYTTEEMIGRSVLELFPPELIDEENVILARLYRGEQIEHYETTRLTKSGKRVAVLLTLSPVYNSDGVLIGVSKIARDVTQRRLLEEAVRSSEKQIRLAAEAGELGFWTYLVPTQTSQWSSRCKTIFGLSADTPSPEYQDSLGLLYPEDRPRVANIFEASIREKRPFDIDFRVVLGTGQLRWVQSRGRPFLDETEAVVEVHGTVIDLTARKMAEEALLRSNSQLQQFAYAAAHNLQEPLRNVSLSVDLAKKHTEGTIPEEVERLLDDAIRHAKQMESMVRDLLAYSTTLDEEEREWPVISADEALDQTLLNLRLQIELTAAQIEREPLPAVRINRIHLVQIFESLISNALKFRGSQLPLIQIGVAAKAGLQLFSVQDNGIGIEPQFHQRVFGIFRRLQEIDVPGTGVGLALCKRIVEHYGGSIWIDPVWHPGARFFFTLPGPT